VFNDQILGVYEKVPNNPGDKILKAENSAFKRLDTSDKEQVTTIKGVRPMAKAAVKALGLLYGGVDVIQDANNNVYVLEVNSSPSLNTLNLDRWVEAVAEYLAGHNNNKAPKEQVAAAPRAVGNARVVPAPVEVAPARENVDAVTRWLREQAQTKGYTITNISLS
jgi:hypothetical protein